MRCEDLMKKEVECVSASDTVQAAAVKMQNANIGFLPVCDAGNRVLGVLTDRDIALRVVAQGRPYATLCGDVMTRGAVACRPQDDIQVAEELMGRNRKSRIICTDEKGALRGVISLSDIAQREVAARAADTFRNVTEREAHVPH